MAEDQTLGLEPRMDFLGKSEAFHDFLRALSRAAHVDRPVLLIGERGTGKELAAVRLHTLSNRWQGPLVALNCSALSPSLIESELFGHEEGAFTGATRRRAGRFESAQGGTLFLDEIGLIPLETQEKILRVVEYGSFERVGGSRPISVDTRIIGATNADLPRLCEEGRFKRDLLDRLSFEALYLPPLRERSEDIMLLANHFASRMALEIGIQEPPHFSEAAEAQMMEYSWPGNVRELKNVAERAVYRSQSPLIEEVIFDPFRKRPAAERSLFPTSSEPSAAERIRENPPSFVHDSEKSFPDAVAEYEAWLLTSALRKAAYNQKKAAEIMKIPYHRFRWIYRKHQKAVAEHMALLID